MNFARLATSIVVSSRMMIKVLSLTGGDTHKRVKKGQYPVLEDTIRQQVIRGWDVSVCHLASETLVYWKLRIDPFIQVYTNGVPLLNHSVKDTLHVPMRANSFFNFATQTTLRPEF